MMGNSKETVRAALSNVLDTVGVYPPRSEPNFPVYGVFVVPTASSSVSTADFKPTKVNLLNVLDQNAADELSRYSSEISEPGSYYLSEDDHIGHDSLINAVFATVQSNFARNSVRDIEVEDVRRVTFKDGRAIDIIYKNLRKENTLDKLLNDHAVKYYAERDKFLLGIVLGVHTGTLKLCCEGEKSFTLGADLTDAAGNVGAQVGANSHEDRKFLGRGVVGIECVYFGVRKEGGGWKISEPTIQTIGTEKALKESVYRVRGRLGRFFRIRRKRPGYWDAKMIRDKSHGTSSYLGPNDYDDSFLGLPGRILTDCALVVNIDVFKDKQFWDDMTWEAVEE